MRWIETSEFESILTPRNAKTIAYSQHLPQGSVLGASWHPQTDLAMPLGRASSPHAYRQYSQPYQEHHDVNDAVHLLSFGISMGHATVVAYTGMTWISQMVPSLCRLYMAWPYAAMLPPPSYWWEFDRTAEIWERRALTYVATSPEAKTMKIPGRRSAPSGK